MNIRTENGLIREMTIAGSPITFHSEDTWEGPEMYITVAGQTFRREPDKNLIKGFDQADFRGILLEKKLEETDRGERIIIRMTNRSSQDFRPDRLFLRLGIDTRMDHYPEWNRKMFPTLLRCELTHFWGYFRSPDGQLLGIASPDPIPAWRLCYNHFHMDCGHLIHTVDLDLITSDPVPERHPVRDVLPAGKQCCVTIELFEADSLTTLLRDCSKICHAPVFDAKRLISEGETLTVRIFCEEAPIIQDTEVQFMGNDEWLANLKPSPNPGLRTYSAKAQHHVSSITIMHRTSWRFCLEKARKAVIEMPQKTGSHCESWYGFFSAFQAARYFPEPETDQVLLNQFRELLPLSFDLETGTPMTIPERIQNTATAISLCADAYEASSDLTWLTFGARLADWLIDNCQTADGAFRRGKTHYTCVIYLAKSILELYLDELQQESMKAHAKKHFFAAKRAIDELILHPDQIDTEGENTFEDGMISCAVTQIAMLALLLPKKECEPYIQAAKTLLSKHRCLERLASPDARSRNTTIRFWEAQYDVLIPANMISSPHGWSAWKVYGVWYLYLLTDDPNYLEDAMETLGSCAGLISPEGQLHWAYIPDPCIKAGTWQPDKEGRGRLKPSIYGEDYLEMISSWYHAPEKTAVFGYPGVWKGFNTDQGGCCDNDVHEIFKAIAEVVLPYAYVYIKNEVLNSYNARFERNNGLLRISPMDPLIQAVHVSMTDDTNVEVLFSIGTVKAQIKNGWIKADGNVQSYGLPT